MTKWAWWMWLSERDYCTLTFTMNSLEEGCTPLKAQYDECFNAWFRDSFLRGKVDHERSCGELFSAYQKCLKV